MKADGVGHLAAVGVRHPDGEAEAVRPQRRRHVQHEAEREMRRGRLRRGKPQMRGIARPLHQGKKAVAGEAVLRHRIGLARDPDNPAGGCADHRKQDRCVPPPMLRIAAPDELAAADAPRHRLGPHEGDVRRGPVRLQPNDVRHESRS